MLNRKLLEVLSRLTPAEHRRLRLFIQSPYYNQQRYAEYLLPLYDYIMASKADESAPLLDKREASLHFFPGKEFREKEKGPIDSMATELFGLVKRFLLAEKTERLGSELQESMVLMRFYREHGLEDRFWQTVATAHKMQESVARKDAAYYFQQFSIEEEICNFRSLFNSFEDDANFVNAHKNLDTYYAILKMEFTCALQYQHKLSQISASSDSPIIQALLQMPEGDFFDASPMVKIYKQIRVLIQNPENQEIFSDFESSLNLLEDKIPHDKYRNMQAYYRYLWGRRYYKFGDAFSRQKMFEVYKMHFEKGYFYEEGKVSIAAFRVLVTFALKMGQFDWAKKVLDEHPPERIWGTRYPAEAHDLNYGEYYFYRKEYEAARDRVNHRPFENPNLGILADVLLIKVYFETEDELLEYRMKALEQKVRRTGMTAFVKERYYNFLKKLDKVVKYGWQKSSPRRDKLVEEIRTIPEIIEREWLLEKLGFAASREA